MSNEKYLLGVIRNNCATLRWRLYIYIYLPLVLRDNRRINKCIEYEGNREHVADRFDETMRLAKSAWQLKS